MGFKKRLTEDFSPQTSEKKDTGDWGELIAAQYLLAQGCNIREQQWRCNHYEIDIVAQRGTRLIFVEVKTRKDKDIDPVASIDRRKRQHMTMAADTYLRTMNLPLDYQFDIISITGTPRSYTLEHIPDAFFPEVKSRK